MSCAALSVASNHDLSMLAVNLDRPETAFGRVWHTADMNSAYVGVVSVRLCICW